MTSAGGSKRAQEKNFKATGTSLDENAEAKKLSITDTAAKAPLKQNPANNKPFQQKLLPSLTGAINPPKTSRTQRTLLNDKSNRGGRTLDVPKDKGKEKAVTKPSHYPPSTQDKSNLRSSAAVIATNTSSRPLQRSEQQQQQQSSSDPAKLATIDTITTAATAAELIKTSTEPPTEAAALNDFFEDNQTRYGYSSSDNQSPPPMQPTSILPIIVPDRIKLRLREKYLGGASTSNSNISDKKRSYGIIDDVQGELLLATRKQQKYGKQQNISDSKEETIIDSQTIPIRPSSSPSSPSSPPSHNLCSQRPIPNFSALEAKRNQPSLSSSSPTSTIQVSQHILDQVKELEDQQDQHAQQQLLQANTTSRNYDDPATQDSTKDPMLVANYADEINAYLRVTESDTMVNPNYMEIQDQVTWRTRDILVDWVADIHYCFHLLPETLFLAVNIIDRFLAKRVVSLSSLQLLGVAALFVASKFEESMSPSMHQYLYMTGHSVTEGELLKAERYILQILDFKLCHPHPLHFLRRCTMTGQFDLRLRVLAKYLMEIAYIDHRFLGTPPSLVAASALWLALKIRGEGTWTPQLDALTGYTAQDLKETVELTLDYLSRPIANSAFFKKWATRRMLKVSIYVRDWVERYHAE